mmetsp:Transcript_7913/g.14903  ORF Transcript_7913/g.14903 Transcript_7913/m.14903 type:complete len:218 (+) Transcript_7913:94-747(+)
MEEEKIQRLHDSLSKLRKGKGLGINSHYSWNAHESIPLKKDKDGNLSRDDGLPVNGLYSNFVKEGSYNPEKIKENYSNKYGDGRAIKRNFDDIQTISDEHAEESSKKVKRKSKEERKAEKKAAKIEAKRQAKLEEKKRLKLEAKRAAKKTKEQEGHVLTRVDDGKEKVTSVKTVDLPRRSEEKKSKKTKKSTNEKKSSKEKKTTKEKKKKISSSEKK